MKIESISISRRASYEMKEADRSEFKAKIAVNGQNEWEPSITITLTEDQLEPIVSIISHAVATNMRRSADAFHEDVQASLAGPALDQLEDQSEDTE